MKDLNTTYESPMVEIIEVEIEKGFATSTDGVGFGGVTDQNL